MLGVIQNILWLVFFGERLASDFAGNLNELPQQRLTSHDSGKLLDAGDVRQSVGQIGEKQHSARRIERVIATQFVGYQNRINLRAALEQSNHRQKDAPVRRHIKIRRLQQFNRLRDQCVVENDGAENCSLRFGTAGKSSLENWVANRIRRGHCASKI